MLRTNYKKCTDTIPLATLRPNVTIPNDPRYFKSTELAVIYNFPSVPAGQKVIGVLSFGGGLIGTVDASGVLTNGDVQAHWAALGISSANFPTVVIVTIGGATNSPNPTDGATIENTLDIETIGGMYPSSELIIILYIVQNALSSFTTLLNAVTIPVRVKNISVTPSVLSCSWGAPESSYPSSLMNSINAQLLGLTNLGINITAATGDFGSSDGTSTTTVDFPSSSPYVVACGGTNLVCPNRTYDSQTREVTWSSGGGGISRQFAKPSYQSAITASGRATPDIALDADPNTGSYYTVGGQVQIYGGTSIVSPAMAAFIALGNINRFVTPLFYSVASSNYNDVLTGSIGAYTAKTGYDNCTGFGSIIGTRLLASINGTTVNVTGLTLNSTSISIDKGTTFQITTTLTPTNSTNRAITFTSQNTAIATVSSSGLVTPTWTGVTGTGSTSIIVTALGAATGSPISVTVPVTVTIPVTSVSLNATTIPLKIGTTFQLIPTVAPVDATNKTVSYASSNASIAGVNATTGLVTGIALGSATITVTTQNGNKKATATATVSAVAVSSIAITNTTPVSVNVGSTLQITYTVLPTNATIKTVRFASSNASIATISASGLVTGIKIGRVTISVTTTSGGKSSSVVVNVSAAPARAPNAPRVLEPATEPATGTVVPATEPATGTAVPAPLPNTSNVLRSKYVTVSPRQCTLNIGASITMKANVLPKTSEQTAVIWSSSNAAVATIHSTGEVVGISSGTTTITAKAEGAEGAEGTVATSTITVVVPVTAIRLHQSSTSIMKGTIQSVSAQVVPENATHQIVTWSSSNNAIATVSNSGQIKGIAKGNVTISALLNGFSSSMRVTIL